MIVFEFSPRLKTLRDSLTQIATFDEVVASFRKFKVTIPTAGAVILNKSLNFVFATNKLIVTITRYYS